MKRILLSFICITLLYLIVYGFILEKPPQYYDITDETKIYFVRRSSHTYTIFETQSQSEIFVAATDRDLEPFVNRKVHLSGKFKFTKNVACQPSKEIEYQMFNGKQSVLAAEIHKIHLLSEINK